MDVDNLNECKDIEDYMKLYCIEEYLDEALNTVVTERPKNPYVLLSQCLESKTLPEIIDVAVNPVLVNQQMIGVKVTLITNISNFCGIASYPCRPDDFQTGLKDYSSITRAIKDVLTNVDFTKLAKVDELLLTVPSIEPAESLAASIACCKAAARHKGVKLHNFIADLTGVRPNQVTLPVPVISVLARFIPNSNIGQEIVIFPVAKLSSFEEELAKLTQICKHISKNDAVKGLAVVSNTGCLSVTVPNISSLLKIVSFSLSDRNLSAEMKIGLNLSSARCAKVTPSESGEIFQYQIDGPPSAAELAAAASPPGKGGKGGKPVDPAASDSTKGLSGAELADLIGSLWQESEFVSLEDISHATDTESIKLVKKKLHDIVTDIRLTRADKLKYCMSGVGGDTLVPLQVLIDAVKLLDVEEVDSVIQDTPFNSVKLRLSSFSCVSHAVQCIRKAKKANLPLVIAISDDPSLPENGETFLADLAVGSAAGQLMAGGLCAGEFSSKYNRILEISQESPSIPFVGPKFRVQFNG